MGISQSKEEKMKNAQESAMRAQRERQLNMQNEMRKKQFAKELAIEKTKFFVRLTLFNS